MNQSQEEMYIRMVNKIIMDEYSDREYIPIQVLLYEVTKKRHEGKQRKPGPKTREFYKLIKDNFEVSPSRTPLSVHTNYKPTRDNPIPIPWLKKAIKAKAKRKNLLTFEELYIIYLDAADREGHKTKGRPTLRRAIEKAGYETETGEQGEYILLI